MNILHLSNTPLSNAPANIAECQRHAGHTATLLLDKQANRNKVFVGGDLWIGFSGPKLEQMFREADIIHMHNYGWDLQIFQKFPYLKNIARDKKFLIQYHSPRAASESFESSLTDPSFVGRRAVLAQYHSRQYPECEHIVPNPLPLHLDRFRLIPKGRVTVDLPLQVSYAPSNTTLRGWDYKGYDVIAPLLKELGRSSLIDPRIIVNTPYAECLAQKAWAAIGVEEFFSGSYHLSFLEYLALGVCAIGHIDDLTKQALATVVGDGAVDALPYVEVKTAAGLREALAYLDKNRDVVQKTGEDARAWMFKHWCPKKMSAHFDAVYSKL